MYDLISRRAVKEKLKQNLTHMRAFGVDRCLEIIDEIPAVQPDEIPLEWIDKHLEWLDNCDNDFAQLAKVSIKAMVELWKKDRI